MLSKRMDNGFQGNLSGLPAQKLENGKEKYVMQQEAGTGNAKTREVTKEQKVKLHVRSMPSRSASCRQSVSRIAPRRSSTAEMVILGRM
jgi:hypothetical protein